MRLQTHLRVGVRTILHARLSNFIFVLGYRCSDISVNDGQSRKLKAEMYLPRLLRMQVFVPLRFFPAAKEFDLADRRG